MLMKVKSLLLIAAAAFAVNASAYDLVADFLSVSPTEVEAGKSDVVLTFAYNGADLVNNINSYQFTLVFPEGLDPNIKAIGKKPDVAITSNFPAADMEMVLSTGYNDKKLSITCVNNSQVNFKEVFGAETKYDLFTVKCTTAADFEKGDITPTLALWADGQNGKLYDAPKNALTISTAVNDINADKAVAGVKYYNVAGVESNEAFDGVNIVVTTYVDGTTSAVKVVK